MSNEPATPPATEPAASSANVELVTGASLNGGLPEVNENAVRAAAPAETAAPAADLGEDKHGRKFDPTKFKPEKDAVGRWKNLRGGRTKGATKTPATTTPTATPAGSVVPASFPDSRADAAKAAATAPQTPAVPVGPDVHELTADAYLRAGYVAADAVLEAPGEWQPDDAREHDSLKNAAAAYLRTRKGEELPPGWAFALAVVTFVLKRLRRLKTSATLAKYFPGLSGWLGVKKPEPAKPTEPEKKTATTTPPPHDPYAGLGGN